MARLLRPTIPLLAHPLRPLVTLQGTSRSALGKPLTLVYLLGLMRVSVNPSVQPRVSYGPPWGLLVAVALLLLFEGVFRLANPRGVLPPSRDRELAYRGVVPELLAYGAPDVAFVGSSRARQAVLAPKLSSALGGRSKVSVGNFALGGAMAEEVEAAIRRILEAERRPRLLVWAISPREFEPRGERPVRQATYLWRTSDWLRSRSELGSAADAFLPQALRNEVALYSYLLRYRFAMLDLVDDPPKDPGRAFSDLLSGKRKDALVHGGIDAVYRTKNRNRVIAVDQEQVQKFIGDSYSAPDWPKNYQAEHFRRALAAARQAKVPLLLVELPLHPLLVSTLPPGTIDRFRALVSETAAHQGASFVTFDELELKLDRIDFQEHSHVNYRGADKYTQALIPIVKAKLGDKERPRQGTKRQRTSRR